MRGITSLMAAALLGLSTAANADEPAPQGFWVTPAIQGFGRMHPLPQAAYKPDPSKTYHIVFSLTKAGQKPGEVSPLRRHIIELHLARHFQVSEP